MRNQACSRYRPRQGGVIAVTDKPRACPGCKTAGVIRVPCRCHRSAACPNHGYRDCDDCGGAGMVQCAYCSEDDGVVQTPLGLYCVGCAEGVAHA